MVTSIVSHLGPSFGTPRAPTLTFLLIWFLIDCSRPAAYRMRVFLTSTGRSDTPSTTSGGMIDLAGRLGIGYVGRLGGVRGSVRSRNTLPVDDDVDGLAITC